MTETFTRSVKPEPSFADKLHQDARMLRRLRQIARVGRRERKFASYREREQRAIARAKLSERGDG